MEDEDRPGERFVVADVQVNRRTSSVTVEEAEVVNPQAAARARLWAQKHALGVPLSDQLAQEADRIQPASVPALGVAALVGGTLMLPCAALVNATSFKAMALGGAVFLYAIAGLAIVRARSTQTRKQAHLASASRLAPGPDPAKLSALDALLDQVSPELPPEQLHALITLKETLVRVSLAARQQGVSPAVTVEDHFYLQQTVSRYLPDTLLAYLRVPPNRREFPLDGRGSSANQALMDQLSLLQQSLEEREARCAQGAGEALLLQERFLKTKANSERRG